MDVNLIRIGVTLLSFALFAGIVWWAWSRRRAAGFREAEMLPFAGDGPAPALAPAPPVSPRDAATGARP